MNRATISSVTRLAHAKINLTLDVFGLRPDGYHEIASIMQSISLADKIIVSVLRGDAGITLAVTGPEREGIPADDSNLAWRAAVAYGEKSVAISIEKNIPSQAGLGGGSSDAAAVLLALNTLSESKRTLTKLAEIGATLGADIPFFLHGGLARVEGLGDRVTTLPPQPSFFLVVVKPPVGVSTSEAYRLLDELPNRISANATSRWPDPGLSNDFEAAIYLRFPEIAAARDALLKSGAKQALLCGSGAAVFGIADDAQEVARRVRAKDVGRVYVTQTILGEGR